MDSGSHCPATALAAAGIVGQWEIDGDSQTVRLDRAGALYRFGNEALAGVDLPVDVIVAVCHPDDLERISAYQQMCLERGGPSLIDHRVILPHLGLRHIQVRGFYGLNERNRVVGRGVLIDMTELVGEPAVTPRVRADMPRLPYAPLFDPLAEAAAHGVEVREALGQTGHGALRLAADLLLFEINTALAERLTVSDKPQPGTADKAG
jgi:hypothetical protein